MAGGRRPAPSGDLGGGTAGNFTFWLLIVVDRKRLAIAFVIYFIAGTGWW